MEALRRARSPRLPSETKSHLTPPVAARDIRAAALGTAQAQAAVHCKPSAALLPPGQELANQTPEPSCTHCLDMSSRLFPGTPCWAAVLDLPEEQQMVCSVLKAVACSEAGQAQKVEVLLLPSRNQLQDLLTWEREVLVVGHGSGPCLQTRARSQLLRGCNGSCTDCSLLPGPFRRRLQCQSNQLMASLLFCPITASVETAPKNTRS